MTTRAVTFLILATAHIAFAQEVKTHPPANTYNTTHRFVFFAVLEGCFEDGVTSEEIDLIIPVRPEREDRRNITTNLVLSCPLCSPAFDAFRLYSDHRIFISKITKNEAFNTFGQGLDAEVRKVLEKKGRPCRSAIQGLIQKWIDRRVAKLRLTEAEEKELRAELAEMREEGEKALKGFQAGEYGEELQKNYQDWDDCPVCSGASPMAKQE